MCSRTTAVRLDSCTCDTIRGRQSLVARLMRYVSRPLTLVPAPFPTLQDGQSVTLEPGGQFELSGAIVDTLHKTCGEVNNHLYQARPHALVFAAVVSAF